EAAPAAAPARINRLELDQRLRQSLVQSWSHCPWQMQPLKAEEVQEFEVELASGSAL
ncbi:MAG TPA: protein ligase, partial [Synechococcus sp. UBA8071]|nr:protein ligase [Synechococcus sp. UBA8071]